MSFLYSFENAWRSDIPPFKDVASALSSFTRRFWQRLQASTAGCRVAAYVCWLSASGVVLALIGNWESEITRSAGSKLLIWSTLIEMFPLFSALRFLLTLPVDRQKVCSEGCKRSGSKIYGSTVSSNQQIALWKIGNPVLNYCRFDAFLNVTSTIQFKSRPFFLEKRWVHLRGRALTFTRAV